MAPSGGASAMPMYIAVVYQERARADNAGSMLTRRCWIGTSDANDAIPQMGEEHGRPEVVAGEEGEGEQGERLDTEGRGWR